MIRIVNPDALGVRPGAHSAGAGVNDKPSQEQLNGYLMPHYEQFIATLAAARIAQGLTLAEVSQYMEGCYLQQVWNWLNGAAECRARRLFALADALGYDVALIPREGA